MLATVAVDFDDVLVPCLQHFVDYCRDFGLCEGSLEGLERPYFEDIFPFVSYESSKVFFEIFTAGEYWEKLHTIPPPPGCLEKLTEIKASGFRLIVVSAREHRFQEITEKYLNEFLPNLFDKVVLCNYYGPESALERKRSSKSEICQKEQCAWLIDDNHIYTKEVEEAMVGTKCVLFGTNSWTVSWKDHWVSKGEKYASNWSELVL